MKTKNRKSKPATSANRKGSAELRSKDLLDCAVCGAEAHQRVTGSMVFTTLCRFQCSVNQHHNQSNWSKSWKEARLAWNEAQSNARINDGKNV
jgi:aspartate oxidase